MVSAIFRRFPAWTRSSAWRWTALATLSIVLGVLSCDRKKDDGGEEVCLRRFDDGPINAVRFCASADSRGGDQTAVRDASENDRPDQHFFIQENTSPGANRSESALNASETLPADASINALSLGGYVLGPWEVIYSVQRNPDPTPAPAGRFHAPAKIYQATGAFQPERSQDSLFRDARTAGLAETPVSDDMTALDGRQVESHSRYFFSIRGSADLWLQEEGMPPRLWMSAQRLGLGPADDIDAVAIQDADLSGEIDSAPDMVIFSVTDRSEGLPGTAVRERREKMGDAGASLFVVYAGDEETNHLFLPPEALGLGAGDELDAVDLLYRGGAEQCYMLPPWDFSFCGDGVVGDEEMCDPGVALSGCGDGSWCDLKCRCRGCGNGIWESEWEQCDPTSGDSVCPAEKPCSDNCRCETSLELCGNAILDAGEECDPTLTFDSCPVDFSCGGECRCIPADHAVCGDGIVESPEMCERNSDCPNDGFCVDCFCEDYAGECGDGRLDADETCEPETVECRPGYLCDARCLCVQDTQPECGDGVLGLGEECDASAQGPAGCSNSLVCRDCSCELENHARIAPDGETQMRLASDQPFCAYPGVWLRLVGNAPCDFVIRYYDADWSSLGTDQGTLQPNLIEKVSDLHEKIVRFGDIPNSTRRIEAHWCDQQSVWEIDCPASVIIRGPQGVIESGGMLCPTRDNQLQLDGPTGLGWQLGSAPSDYLMGEGVLGDPVAGAGYPGPRSIATIPLDNYPHGDDMISLLTSAFDFYAWPIFCSPPSQSFDDPNGDLKAILGFCDPAAELLNVEVSYPEPSFLKCCWTASSPLQRIEDEIIGYSLFIHGPDGAVSTLDPYFDYIEYEIQLRIDGQFPNVTPTADIFDERDGQFVHVAEINPLDIELAGNTVCASAPLPYLGNRLTVSGLEGRYLSAVAFQFGVTNECIDVLNDAGYGGNAQFDTLQP